MDEPAARRGQCTTDEQLLDFLNREDGMTIVTQAKIDTRRNVSQFVAAMFLRIAQTENFYSATTPASSSRSFMHGNGPGGRTAAAWAAGHHSSF